MSLENQKVPVFLPNPLLEPQVRALRELGTSESLALAAVLERIDVEQQKSDWAAPIVLDTYKQARATNGRVTRLEGILRTVKVVACTLLGLLLLLAATRPELPPWAHAVLRLIAG